MSKDTDQFIKKYGQDVINATAGTGIFPSVKMAQFIIEAADSKGKRGNGITFVKANNGFGIKADKSWKGPKMAFSTPKDGKPVNYFRVYATPFDSIKDHTEFLKKMPRYTKAGVFSATTPEQQIDAIHAAHYSESPTYNVGLKKIIDAYNLKSLDGKPVKKTSSNKKDLFVIGGLALLVGAFVFQDDIKKFVSKYRY